MTAMQEISRFYKRRRMFAIIGGRLLIAPSHNLETHQEWLARAGYTCPLDSFVRGYYYAPSNVVAFYHGANFAADEADIVIFKWYLPDLVAKNIVPTKAIVWAGVKPSEDVIGKWPARQVFGTVSEFIKS